MNWEDLKPMFRPSGVHMGVMKVDPAKCNHCGLCLQACPFDAWEMHDDKVPVMKKDYQCFSCSNCIKACPRDAITLVSPYHVTEGFFASSPRDVAYTLPEPPLNAEGAPDQWNEVERNILERRSIRNFKDRPVPESLICRVLEAGRYAPSAANGQPWRFIVISDKNLIAELDSVLITMLGQTHDAYMDDSLVQQLIPVHEAIMVPGLWDPRIVVGGMKNFSRGPKPPLLRAPVIIIICGDRRAASGPALNIGICGQNMVLAARSLGLGACWVGWTGLLNGNAGVKDKLGVVEPWELGPSIALGYPRFKQDGIVARQNRLVTWFRE